MNPLAALATIQTPDETQLTTRAQAALKMVESMSIDTDDDYALAADELKAIKSKANTIEAQRTAITGPINAALKAINDLFRGPASYLAQAEKTIKDKMLGYSAAQERIAAEARRVAEEAAAAERARLAAEARKAEEAAAAEGKRLADIEALRQREAKAEQDRLAKIAADAKAAGDAEAARIANEAAQRQREADAIEAAKAAEQAAAARQAAAMEVSAIENVASVIVAAPVTAAPVKVGGISSAKSFDFEVTDLHALVKHIAAHPEHISLVAPDAVRLRGLVKSLGMNTNLPGVRVFTKSTLRAA